MIVTYLNPCRNCGSPDIASHMEAKDHWHTGCRTCFRHTNLFPTAAESREEWNNCNSAPKDDKVAPIQRRLDECHTWIATLLNSPLVFDAIKAQAYDILTKHRLEREKE